MADSLMPTNGSGRQTSAGLRTHSYTGKEYIADRVKRPLFSFPNVVAAADLVGMGAGTADLDEVNATEIAGLECATTESYSVLWVMPDELEVASAIDARILWCDEAAASTKSQTITATYQAITAGTDTMVAPATAVGTAIAAKADLAADIPHWSSYATIAAATITDTPGEDLVNWKFTWTLDTLGAAWFLAGQVRFYRRFVG